MSGNAENRIKAFTGRAIRTLWDNAARIAGVVLIGSAIVYGVAFLFGYANSLIAPAAEERWNNFGSVKYESTALFNKLMTAKSPNEIPAVQDFHTDWTRPNTSVYTTSNSTPPPPAVTLKDLSDQGQAHAIDAILKDPAKADKTWIDITRTLGPGGGEPEHKDPYRADRILIATVAKGIEMLPGERILWTRIFVQPINFEFAGYTIAQTDNKTIKVANIESTQSNKLTLNTGLDSTLPALTKPTAEQNIENTEKATADVNEQYEALGVDIRPDFLRVIRESGTGGDVAGNTAVQLSLLTTPTTILLTGKPPPSEKKPSPDPTSGMFNSADDDLSLVVANAHLTDGVNYLSRDDAKITILPQTVLSHCPLRAKVWMVYAVRHIMSGRANFVEGRQRVELIRDGEDAHEVELVRADDISPAVWTIERRDRFTGHRIADVEAHAKGGSPHVLRLTDYTTASELTHWLRINGPDVTIGDITFDWDTKDLLVPVKHIKNDCENN
jgi:hypothetical protein